MGGPPNPGTPKDMRKKSNNPNAGKSKVKAVAQTKVTKAAMPVKATKARKTP